MTTYPEPRYLLIVFAFDGDSTITRCLPLTLPTFRAAVPFPPSSPPCLPFPAGAPGPLTSSGAWEALFLRGLVVEDLAIRGRNVRSAVFVRIWLTAGQGLVEQRSCDCQVGRRAKTVL